MATINKTRGSSIKWIAAIILAIAGGVIWLVSRHKNLPSVSDNVSEVAEVEM